MKNILIAGGTDGIGLAFVKQLNPKQYHKIFILGRNFSQVKPLQIPNAILLTCDITDPGAATSAIAAIDQPLDQFVNTVGTFHRAPIAKITPNDVERHFALNSVGNINLTNEVLKKLNGDFAEVVVCLATLALEARQNYALQSATKAAYRYYLEALREERKGTLKVMMVHPSSVNTGVFVKSGDMRDTSGYPSPANIAKIMQFMLTQPREVYIPDIRVNNF